MDVLDHDYVRLMRRHHPGSVVALMADEIERLREASEGMAGEIEQRRNNLPYDTAADILREYGIGGEVK